jgi:hypothetical protein
VIRKLHISTVATATESTIADADFQIEDASPFSQPVMGDLKKKKNIGSILSGNRVTMSDSYVGHCPCLWRRTFPVLKL